MNNHIRTVYRYLLGQIAGGELKPGDLVPTEKELSEKFNTTRMNIYRVFKLLNSHNLIVSRKRAGTSVSANPDMELASLLLDESNRLIYVLYSQTPHYIHWDNRSFESLESIVGKKDYTVYYKHIPAERNRDKLKQVLEEATLAGISAMVIFPDSEDVAFLDENNDLLVDSKTPIFILNRGSNVGNLDFASTISLDNFGDGITIGRILRQNGFTHIIVLQGSNNRDFWHLRRLEGIRVGIKNCRPGKKIEIEGIDTSPEKYEYALKMIEKDKEDRKLAFVAINNLFAAQFMDFCSRKNLSSGRDYDLLAFDDNPIYRSYGITSMAVRVREIGEIFGKMICDNSWFKDYPGRITVRLASNLVIRSSCRELKY